MDNKVPNILVVGDDESGQFIDGKIRTKIIIITQLFEKQKNIRNINAK
jgi:hypothetical protein